MCRLTGVSPAGYYKSNRSVQEDTDIQWYHTIKAVKSGYKESYGYRKVCFELNGLPGIYVNHKKIYRIMVKYGLLSKIRRKKRSNYRSPEEGFVNIYENKLNRHFKQDEPNNVWLQDITELKLKDGRLYVSAILDAYRSRLVSYRYSTNNNVDLVMSTLKAAMETERVKMLHSDRGFQYTSMPYRKLAEENKIALSMSAPGNPKDNAPMESFFSVLKTECIYRRKPKTIAEAIQLIHSFADYYNNERVILKYDGAPQKFSYPSG